MNVRRNDPDRLRERSFRNVEISVEDFAERWPQT